MDTDSTASSQSTNRKKDIYAFFMGVTAQFFWGISNIQLKTYRGYFPDAFSPQSLTFWRSFSICIVGYFMIKRKNGTITPVSEIKNKFWFFLRSGGNYFIIVLWIYELTYFRVSTCQSFSTSNPVIILLLSSFVLHEPFYMRYVYGVLISFVGTLMIVFNDKKDKDAHINNKTSFDMFVGVVIALTHMCFVAFSNFGQKLLCKEKLSPEVQNFYLGLFNFIPALFMMVAERKTGLENLLYVTYAFSNGFLFYLANYCMAECLNIMPMNKFTPMNYLKIVFIFIFGFVILGEKVFFTDIIGSALIVGFQVYNVFYPVKSTKRNREIKNENLSEDKVDIKTKFLRENDN